MNHQSEWISNNILVHFFIRFLKENNAYSNYIHYLNKKYKNIIIDTFYIHVLLCIKNPFDFSWHETDEGYEFWRSMDEKWNSNINYICKVIDLIIIHFDKKIKNKNINKVHFYIKYNYYKYFRDINLLLFFYIFISLSLPIILCNLYLILIK